MGDVGGPATIRLLSPGTEDEWGQAEALMAELKEWDVQQSQALGFHRDEVLSLFYPDDISGVRRDTVPPNGLFLLAADASSPMACAAFRPLTSSGCELYHVYARPSCRGRGGRVPVATTPHERGEGGRLPDYASGDRDIYAIRTPPLPVTPFPSMRPLPNSAA